MTNIQQKVQWALEKTSTPVYNRIRKWIGCMIRFALRVFSIWNSIELCGYGCYFFLLWLSKYDSAVKITNNKVNTSIVFIGHPSLCTRGHLIIESASAFYSIYTFLLYHAFLIFQQKEIIFFKMWLCIFCLHSWHFSDRIANRNKNGYLYWKRTSPGW